MATSTNILAARKLVERYRSITIGEIREVWHGSGYDAAQELTGYGGSSTCTLCQSVNDECGNCIYNGTNVTKGIVIGAMPCLNGRNRNTFFGIDRAKTPIELQRKFRQRAKLIESYLKNI
jgi:hypothetical protein